MPHTNKHTYTQSMTVAFKIKVNSFIDFDFAINDKVQPINFSQVFLCLEKKSAAHREIPTERSENSKVIEIDTQT